MTASPDLGAHAAASLGAGPASDAASAPVALPVSQPPTATAGFDSTAFRSVFRRHAAGVAVITARRRAAGRASPPPPSPRSPPSRRCSPSASAAPVLQLAGHRRSRPRRRPHTRRAPARSWPPPSPAAAPTASAPPTAWRDRARGGAASWTDVLAWLVCRVVARIPAGDHRIVSPRPSRATPAGARPPAALPPGPLQRAARLRAPRRPRAPSVGTGHSSKRLLSGDALGVLASNISFGAPAAPTGIRRSKAPMLPARRQLGT